MVYRPGVCNFCGTGCGHLMKVSDGAIRGVSPTPAIPWDEDGCASAAGTFTSC